MDEIRSGRPGNQIKGEQKTLLFENLMCNFLMNRWSQEAVLLLISTPSPEKDSLLGPNFHEKIAHQILKKEVFLITLYLKEYQASLFLLCDPWLSDE